MKISADTNVLLRAVVGDDEAQGARATAALEEAGGEKWTIDRVLDSHKKGIDVKKVRV